MKAFLSIIIPVYNESERISNTLLEIDRYLTSERFKEFVAGYNTDQNVKGYEIIVVDDGSRDNTVEIARNFRGILKNLKVIANDQNHGKGYVVRQGMLAARGRFRIFTDADNSTSIDHIERALPYFYGRGIDGIKYSMVIGSRSIKGVRIAVRQPFYKEILGKLGNKFIQIVAVWGIFDTQCGFKGFEEKAARAIFKRVSINRWGFDIEVLAIARLLEYKIKEFPVTWINDPKSHVTLIAYLQVLWETVRVRVNIWRGKYK